MCLKYNKNNRCFNCNILNNDYKIPQNHYYRVFATIGRLPNFAFRITIRMFFYEIQIINMLRLANGFCECGCHGAKRQ